MKYHTTASTIIISILVLLCFAVVSMLCILGLGISSPGLMVVEALSSLQGQDGRLSLSFDSMERNLSGRIQFNDVTVSWDDEDIIEADSLVIYQGPFSLLASFITGEGLVQVDINSPRVVLDGLLSSGGGGGHGGGASPSIDQLNQFIQSLESYDSQLSGQAWYDLAYSLNIHDLALVLPVGISVDGVSMNLSLGPHLDFEGFTLAAPSFNLALQGVDARAGGLAFLFSKDEAGYHGSLSLDSTKATFEGGSASLDDMALRIDFPTFADLDLRQLPVMFSSGHASLSYNGLSASFDTLSAQGRREGLDMVLLGTSLSYGGWDIGLPRLDLAVDPSGGGFTLRVQSSAGPKLEGAGVSIQLAGLSASADISSALTFSIQSTDASLSGLEEVSGGTYSSLTSNDISISGQMNSQALYLEGSADVLGHGTGFFDSSRLGLSFSALFEGSSFSRVELDVDTLSFQGMEDVFTASLHWTPADGLSGSAAYGDSLSLDIAHEARLGLAAFPLYEFSALIDSYLPALHAYIGPDTTVGGSLSLSLDGDSRGSLLGSLALGSLHFNEYSFGIGLNLDADLDGDLISISSLSLSTQWVRLSFTGSISLSSRLPQGTFGIDMTDSGNRVLNVDFYLDNEEEYFFNATIPVFENGWLRGSVNWARDGLISSAGELRSGRMSYPFDLSIDLSSSRADLVSSGLSASLDFSQDLEFNIAFNDFMLPGFREGAETRLDGSFSFAFDFAAQSYHGHSTGFRISALPFIHSRPDLSFDLVLDNSQTLVDNIRLSDEWPDLTGQAVYLVGQGRFAMTLGNSDERINLSLVLDSDGYSGILTLSSLRLDRFGLPSSRLDTSLTGRGASADDFSFSGALRLAGGEDAGRAYQVTGDLVLDNRGFTLTGLGYSTDSLSITAPSLAFDAGTGLFDASFLMHFDKVNRDRTYPVDAQLTLNAQLPAHDSLVETVLSFMSEGVPRISASLGLDYLVIDNGISIRDRRIGASYDAGRIDLTGDLLSGWVMTDPVRLDLTIADNEIIHGRLHGTFSPDDINIQADDLHFNLGSLDFLFPKPLVVFHNPSWVYLDAIIYGSIDDTHIYGQGGSDGFDMEVFWLTDAVIHVGDTQVSVVDNHASTNMTPLVVTDNDNGDVHRGYAIAEAQLSNANLVDFFSVQLHIPEGESVFVTVPVYSYNFQLKGDVTGDFTIWSDMAKINLSGDLIVNNSTTSIGMDPLPGWWGRSGRQVRNEYSVHLGSNNAFVLPLGDNPIILAYFDEDLDFTFTYDSQTKEKDMTGTLSFRSGEIFYFQKNFFIEEGSLAFPETGTGVLNPLINLRARLRDFNEDGERVDIYLVLNNASLDNINPVFESSPQMRTEEIMSILGASILPSSAYGTSSMASIASMLSSGLDILGRTGIINTSSTGDVVNVIRDSLGLDIFSLHSNIIENFLLDALFQSGGSSGYRYSPVATYLNNTSIYLGKYITQDIYLQMLFNLQAQDFTYNRASFLSNDLSLDLEISLEWETPLGTVTFFTTPPSLTLFSLVDNFGIRYTKTIDF